MSPDLLMADSETFSTADPVIANSAATGGRARAVFQTIGQTFLILLLATGSYFLVSHFLVESVTVVGVSMVPTLHNSEHYLLNRWVYYVRAPKPEDVIVLRDPADHGLSVKRIIAVGGDSIALKDGRVYINGRLLSEPYLPPGIRTFASASIDGVYKCPKDAFFVLGDNRNNSVDSRAYGPVPRGNVLGLIIR